MIPAIYTIGHSTHSSEKLLQLLKEHVITTICDVRSHPYSRYNSQFNREALREVLKSERISYVYLGKELGGRSSDKRCYRNGQIQYDLLANTEVFRQGINRLKQEMRSHQLSLMCAEKDPLQCHRTILVSRRLVEEGIPVFHILADGSLETHEQALERLLTKLKLLQADMFRSNEEIVREAYGIQGDAIAYQEKTEGIENIA